MESQLFRVVEEPILDALLYLCLTFWCICERDPKSLSILLVLGYHIIGCRKDAHLASVHFMHQQPQTIDHVDEGLLFHLTSRC